MNKIFIITLVLCTFFFAACGQNSDVPSKVKTAFKNKISNAKNLEWEFDKEDNLWEAEYKINNTEYTSVFTKEGSWIETEHSIKHSDLPQAVKNTLKADYPEYEIEEIEFVETPEGKYYELEVELENENKEVEYELLIKADGKVVKKEEEKDEKEED